MAVFLFSRRAFQWPVISFLFGSLSFISLKHGSMFFSNGNRAKSGAAAFHLITSLCSARAINSERRCAFHRANDQTWKRCFFSNERSPRSGRSLLLLDDCVAGMPSRGNLNLFITPLRVYYLESCSSRAPGLFLY